MSAGVAQARLKDALRDLKARWETVRGDWDDAAAREFTKDVIEPLELRVLASIGAMGRMSEVIAAARRDCGSDQE